MAATLDWVRALLAMVLGFVAAKGHSQIRWRAAYEAPSWRRCKS